MARLVVMYRAPKDLVALGKPTSRPTFRLRRKSPVSESTRSAKVLSQPLGPSDFHLIATLQFAAWRPSNALSRVQKGKLRR